jgi:hypothetical protein
MRTLSMSSGRQSESATEQLVAVHASDLAKSTALDVDIALGILRVLGEIQESKPSQFKQASEPASEFRAFSLRDRLLTKLFETYSFSVMVGIVLVLTAGVTGYLSQHVRACTLPNHARLPSSRAIVPPRLAAAKATEKEVPMPMSTMDRDGTSFSTGTPGPLVLDGTTKLQLGVLLSCSLLIQMGVGMIIVALPMYASGLGLGAGGVGLIIALPQLTKLLFNLPLGYFIDVVGRKPALVLGSLLDAIGQYGTAVASGLRQLALPRLLIGVGSASSACSTQAYTLDVVGKFPQHSGLLLGLIQAVGFLAFALGPELGGRYVDCHR